MSEMDKVVVLARGVGTRMRKGEQGASLTQSQSAIADTGVKAMMPIERPFLDYVLGEIADAGYKRVCLVIGPEHDVVRKYYGDPKLTERLQISFAVQEKPRGTADAVAAARDFCGNDSFLMINSDNLYPREAVEALRHLREPGLAVFDKQSMLKGSNVGPERIARFAVVDVCADGYLKRIIEKPDEATLAAMGAKVGVSMNCWRFDKSIFEACAKIPLSVRGEYEIPDAVQYSMDKLSVKFRVLDFHTAVLDLSSRADVGPVAKMLVGKKVRL
jgi:dTDP-glucose pyrophosphorylase